VQIWSVTLTTVASRGGYNNPIYDTDNDCFYVSESWNSSTSKVDRVQRSDGRIVWSRSFSYYESTLSYYRGVVYASLHNMSGTGAHAVLDASDGSVIWQRDAFFNEDGWGACAVDDRYLSFTAHGRGNTVIVQDRFTGELVWSTGIASIGCCSNPVMSDGMGVLGSEDLLIGIRTVAPGYAVDSPRHGTNACGYNVGAIVWPSSGNTPPIVNLISPANASTYTAPATLNLAATASDPDGTIANVRFYRGNTLLATDTASPYESTPG